MRNSSLVEGFCAENVTGLKLAADAVDVQVQRLSSAAGGAHASGLPTKVRVYPLIQRLNVVGELSSGSEGRL